ncbi:MAG: hypothetical protein KGI08_01960 [Thaumarchaeota archaeon]|nr:hypothetical protein [Nitrososphaerota archaeon]
MTRRMTKARLKKRKQIRDIIYVVFIVFVIIGLNKTIFPAFAKKLTSLFPPVAQAQIISPIATVTPIVEPTATPTPTPYSFDTQKEIRTVWGKDARIGLAIASCESGANPDKYNINSDGTIDFSVFQINTVHGVILDPRENIRFAYKLFLEQGTTPWNSSKACWGTKI